MVCHRGHYSVANRVDSSISACAARSRPVLLSARLRHDTRSPSEHNRLSREENTTRIDGVVDRTSRFIIYPGNAVDARTTQLPTVVGGQLARNYWAQICHWRLNVFRRPIKCDIYLYNITRVLDSMQRIRLSNIDVYFARRYV